MIFDREQFRRRLVRRLTDRTPSVPGFIVDELVADALAALDEQLDQPATGPTHPPVELVVSLDMLARSVPNGVRVSCDGHALEARPYWRPQPVDDPDHRKFYGGGG